MNLTATILTSALVSAIVTGIFALCTQAIERKTRRQDALFLQSVELAKANREFIAMVAEKTGQTARIHDYVVYAEMYYWLLSELQHTGKLPKDWRSDIKEKFGEL